jgi:hypothetical protein
MLRKRREIQRARRVGLADLDGVLTAEPWAKGSLAERVRATAAAVAPAFGFRSGKRT